MNDITLLLNLEDENAFISNIEVLGNRKIITIETEPKPHYCPLCSQKMKSRGVHVRNIRHPILQDGYSLEIKLKQRRWRCTNATCSYEANESFRFVDRYRQTTNATDLLIVNAFRDINMTAAEIGRLFHVSDHHALDVFDKYVDMPRLKLTSIISVDEVYLDMDPRCKYVLVLQDFFTGDCIDLVKSRQQRVTEPYLLGIPLEERRRVKYLISDMYNPYLAYVDRYFPNAVPVVDSFHVMQWILHKLDLFLRQLLRLFKERDNTRLEQLSAEKHRQVVLPTSDEVYLLQHHKWVLLRNQSNIDYSLEPKMNMHFRRLMDTYDYEKLFLALHPDLPALRDLKEEYVRFNARNAGNPLLAARELDELISRYKHSDYDIFREFASTLMRYKLPIINSFIMAERQKQGTISASRLSNGPMESLNRKAKDLKRAGRGYNNFAHLRNRFLFSTRKNPPLKGS